MRTITFRLVILCAVLLALIAAGTLGFRATEGLSFLDALYFTVVTVSTVGYGDIHASTVAGRILVVALIVVGVGTFLGVIANTTEVLLQRRDERVRKERLNTLIGVFFSEIGTPLLHLFSASDTDIDRLREEVVVDQNWTDKDFAQLQKLLERHTYTVQAEQIELKSLRNLLKGRSDLLIRLLGDPDLREHESFTNLLRAIFHLKDELVLRPSALNLPQTDVAHLANDSKRACALLTKHWIDYMLYLKRSYPYLFSLALRTNPFLTNLSPMVE